jgi:hypothetical protein
MKSEEKIAVVERLGFKMEETKSLFAKFSYHHHGAPRRGLQTDLTFENYLQKVREAGVQSSDQIGQRNDQFVLARHGDQGHYTNDNCRFVTGLQNRQEAWENGRNNWVDALRGQTKETSDYYRRISEAQKGRTKETHEYIAKRAELVTGRTKGNHEGVAVRTDKLAKDFVATGLDGRVHEGRNLTEFCQANNLEQANMSAVFRGKRPHHKGWTGHYVPEEPIFSAYFHELE